uniref:Helicase VP6 n=1 Tax=Changuinola virus TaxID=40052 RepID=U5YJC2_9REOV|nr:helicase VP6 [Changuinola virus]
MSIAVLLVPGDLIEKIKAELIERQIQVDLVDWKKEEKETDNASENSSTKEKSNREGLGGETKTDNEEKDKVGKTGDQDREGDGGKREKILQHEHVQRGGGSKEGDGMVGGATTRSEAGAGGEGRMGVLTDEISKRIKQKLGVDVDVYPKGETILFLEKHVQNELLLDKEQIAQQLEVLRLIQKKEKKDRVVKIEKIMSMKKLTDLVGKKDVNEKPISARQSGVRLVSNNIKHVNKATAYFTAPTGDTNWKNVAREAAKNSNIMAYHSDSDDTAKDLLHLIDHL